MEVKLKTPFLSSLLTLFFIYLSVTSTHSLNLKTQTLIIHTLPYPTTLSQPESRTQQPDPDSTNFTNSTTLSFPLHHINALSLNKTPSQLFHLTLQRDAARVQTLISLTSSRNKTRPIGSGSTRLGSGSKFTSPIISGLTQGSGEYFTRIGVGTPPKFLYLVLDTGSDVVWLQCKPCTKCYSQTDPIFNPKKSKTFNGIPCGSHLCNNLDSQGCNTKTNLCQYQVSYGDGSFTVGDFSTETLTFRNAQITKVALGCGHDNQGLFVGAAGLLGLGRGKLSFPSQTGNRFNNKFSYCLTDRTASTKPSSIIFGESAFSRTARFTPLIKNPKLDTFYYIELLGISVGGAPVRGISASLFRLDSTGNGGVIIDSGSSVTRLTRPAYVALRNAFRVGASHLKRASEFSLFDTCYDLTGLTEVKVPTVVLHFRGADVSLPAGNYLIPVDDSGSFCFAFAETMSQLSIVGNIQQQGFRVVFDLAGSRVGFVRRGCM